MPLTQKPEGRKPVKADYWSTFTMPCGAELRSPVSAVLGIFYDKFHGWNGIDLTRLQQWFDAAETPNELERRKTMWMGCDEAYVKILEPKRAVDYFKGRGLLVSMAKLKDLDSPPQGLTPEQVTHIMGCPTCQAAVQRPSRLETSDGSYWDDVAAGHEATRAKVHATHTERCQRYEAACARDDAAEDQLFEERVRRAEETRDRNKAQNRRRTEDQKVRAVAIRDRELAELDAKADFVNRRRQRA